MRNCWLCFPEHLAWPLGTSGFTHGICGAWTDVSRAQRCDFIGKIRIFAGILVDEIGSKAAQHLPGPRSVIETANISMI